MTVSSRGLRLLRREEAPFLTLLLALMAMLVAHPLLGNSLPERILLSLLFSGVLLSGLWSAASNRREFRIGLLLLAPAIVGQWIVHATGSPAVLLGRIVFTVMFFLFTATVVLRNVLRDREVTVDTISGGICVYLLLALTYAMLFVLAELLAPGSFEVQGQPIAEGARAVLTSADSFGVAIYLSLVTITTLGYGDVLPITSATRMLAATEAFIGQLFLAVFIARLVALHTAQGMKRD